MVMGDRIRPGVDKTRTTVKKVDGVATDASCPETHCHSDEAVVVFGSGSTAAGGKPKDIFGT